MTLLAADPIALKFPKFGDEDFEALKADIKANGQQVPIELYKGQILDGVNRYRACTELGVAPQLRAYDGPDPLGHAVSLNLKRRHLTETQKGTLSHDLRPLYDEQAAERMKAGQAKPGHEFMGNQHKAVVAQAPGPQPLNQALTVRGPQARDLAAAATGVSGRTVDRVARVARVLPELMPQLRNGTLDAKPAEAMARSVERHAIQAKLQALKSEKQIEREKQEEEARAIAQETWERLNRTLDVIYGLQRMLPARAAELTPSSARTRAIKKSNDLMVWLETFVDTLENQP